MPISKEKAAELQSQKLPIFGWTDDEESWLATPPPSPEELKYVAEFYKSLQNHKESDEKAKP